MSLLKANAVQLGQSITATNNFVLYQPASPDGTVRLGNGNSGSVTDLVTVGSTGNLTFTGTTETYNNSVVISAASTKSITLNGGGLTNGLVLNASNNVGIGTASTGYKLYVTGNTPSGGIFVQTDSTANASPIVRVQGSRSDVNTSQCFSGGLALERYSSSAAIGSGQILGTIYFGGNYSGSSMGYAASISAVASANWSSTTTANTDLVFYTGSTAQTALGAANVSYGTEQMRIDSAGNFILTAAGSINLNALNTYSNAASGYQKLPSGIIIQWGTTTFNASGVASITFPVAFPYACRFVNASIARGTTLSGYLMSTQVGSYTATGVTIIGNYTTSGSVLTTSANESAAWVAIGY